MSDKTHSTPPSFTPQNDGHNNQFNKPKSFSPVGKVDKNSPATTPPTQIQRMSGQVSLTDLHLDKSGKKSKNSKLKKNGKKKLSRVWKIIIAIILVFILFIVGVLIWANSRLLHENALTNKADNSSATTFLIAGSDARDKSVHDDTAGGRSDTIMLLTLPKSGTPSLISIPRDSYVDIDGYGANKLNAAYSYGGSKLMVKTIEENFNIKIDHFIEMGFDGLLSTVDSVGKLHLCLDYDVDDNDSGLKWKAGCHDVDGGQALAFSRMRYADPLSDIGRTLRQRQVINELGKKIYSPDVLLNPFKAFPVANTSLDSMIFDERANIFDVAQAFFGFKDASGDKGAHGTLPIKSMGYNAGAAGSVLLLDDDEMPAFMKSLQDGSVKPGEVGGLE
ncbi:MAG: LCP family protein [Bifidobacteriaceae bacterium]|jgi:LCP family protein required for cell wall assembly|nr:LCP family protein [Bifidobacteriaceae bacterium]